MNFPFNVLGTAQTVIGTQTYSYEEWSGRTQNARGIYVDSYTDAVDRKASVQAMTTKEISVAGLEMNQVYIKILDTELINILTRSDNPPRITWDGYYYQPVSEGAGNWMTQGGWNRVVCARQEAI